jgi:hypothetical protein
MFYCYSLRLGLLRFHPKSHAKKYIVVPSGSSPNNWHKIGRHTFNMPSSVIRYYHYYPGEQRLRITYTSGAIYDYLGVPADVYTAMKEFQSKGTFLNRQIKGHYPFKKVS